MPRPYKTYETRLGVTHLRNTSRLDKGFKLFVLRAEGVRLRA